MDGQDHETRSPQLEEVTAPDFATIAEPIDNLDYSASAAIETAANQALNFLGNASNETLGACLVGLGAATYWVLGRVGLVLIGVVGGVALHASWEGSGRGEHHGEEQAQKKLDINRRKETGLEVARRVLDWRLRKTIHAEADNSEIYLTTIPDYSTFRPATAAALDTLTDAVIRDYVKWWYSPIVPTDLAFPSTCRTTLTSFITSLSTNLSRKRPADTFLDFVTNSSSIVIVFLGELSAALSASSNQPAPEAIQAYLEARPESSLGNILDRRQQEKKFHMVADEILDRFLDASVYRCSPARVFLREIFANVVLEKTLQSCCRSVWINDWIIYLLEQAEPEIIHVIDSGIEGSAVQQAAVDEPISTKQEPQIPEPLVIEQVASTQSAINTPRSRRRARTKTFEVTEDGIVVDTTVEDEEEYDDDDEDDYVPPRFRVHADDDGSDSTTHGVPTPLSSEGEMESRTADTNPSFTSFDQLAPSQSITALASATPGQTIRRTDIMTLHRANMSIFDDSDPSDRRALRSRPDVDYLIQIEPASSHFPGWMISRTYEDFEVLHEVLRRIATISGLSFVKPHPNVPQWRGTTKAQLRDELERYLIDAVSYESLAESEGMRRFFDKDRGFDKSPTAKATFWPNTSALENMSKGVMGAFTKAPKGALEGVTSAMTGSAVMNDSRRSIISPSPLGRTATSSELNRGGLAVSPSPSQDSSRRPSAINMDSPKQSSEHKRSSSLSRKFGPRLHEEVSLEMPAKDPLTPTAPRLPPRPMTPAIELPPHPTDVDDDYLSPAMRSWPATPQNELEALHVSIDETYLNSSPSPITRSKSPLSAVATTEQTQPPKQKYAPFSEQEAQVTVELLFAVINELYTLSSAWNFRRTLLTAAKTFLVRAGNPQLESIRVLLQETIIEANISDEGIAAHILKLRENSVPTVEEYKTWPPPPSEEQIEASRKKARKLLVEKGMPQALTSVMGAAASGEALGKVFDCLQVEDVARGLMFGLILQAVRAVAQ